MHDIEQEIVVYPGEGQRFRQRANLFDAYERLAHRFEQHLGGGPEMEIYIIRHGDAIDRAHPEVANDAMRWLTEVGRDEVAVTARLLARLGVKPDLVLTSPLVRARQTAEIITELVGPASGPEETEHLIYGGSLAGVLAAILERGRPRQVVLAGHMPSVGELVGYLAWEASEYGIPFRTGEVARLDLPDDALHPGYGDLRWLIPPKIARKLLENP